MMKMQNSDANNSVLIFEQLYQIGPQADADLLFNSTKRMGNYTDAVNVFIQNSTKSGIFKIDTEAIFAKETYIVVWKYLSMMYEGESLNEMGKNPFSNTEYQNDDIWIALKNVLLPNIVTFNITLDQLKSTFDGKFKKFRGDAKEDCFLQVAQYYTLDGDCSSSGQNITFVGTDHLCFKVRGQRIIFFSYGGVYKYTQYPCVKLLDDNIEGIRQRNPSLTIDFSGRWTPPDLSTAKKSNEIIEFNFDQWITIYITQPKVMKSMAYKQRKSVCSNEYTLTECLNECRTQLIRNMCDCLPATLSTHDQDKRNELCTFEKYEKCLKYVGDEDSECKAQCVPNCENWNFEFDIKSYSSSMSKSQAEFYIDSSVYVIFTEIPKRSFEEFIGALGGALGLYLGLDFIILIHFVFEPIFMLIRKWITSRNAVVDNGTHQIQENTGEKSNFEKFREFIKKHIPTEDASSRSMFGTYLIEKLFWIVLYTSGGIHTVYLCYGLYQQYADGPIISSIVLMNNNTIALPKPTLCMNHGGYFVEILDKVISHDTTLTYTDLLTEYFNPENMTRLKLLGEEEWPKPLLAITSQYVNIMNLAEVNEIYYSNTIRTEINGYYNIQLTYKSLLKKLSKSTQKDMKNAMENVFEPSLKRLNVSINEVRTKLSREIAKLVRMKVNFVKADLTTISLVNETKLTLFNEDHICFQLPFDKILYFDESEYFDVSADISTYSYTYGGFSIDFDAQLTLSDSIKTTDAFNALYLYCWHGESYNLSVGLSGHYKTVSKRNGNAECTIAREKEVCLATCRISLVQVLCNCTPITWPTLLSADTNLCSLSQYNQCLNYSVLEDRKCREKCAEPCERYVFFYDVTKEVRNETAYVLRRDAANLRIYVRDFSYILYEDRFQWSFGEFLASLGGMLGLWLGLTVYTVASLVTIIPISFFVDFCSRKEIVQKLLNSLRTFSEERIGVFTSITARQLFCQIFNLDNQNLAKILTTKWITKIILITLYHLTCIILTYQMCADIIHKYFTVTESSYNFQQNDTINLISYPTVCTPHSVNLNLLPFNQTADRNFNEEIIKLLWDFITNNDTLLLGDITWPKSFLNIAISFIAFYGKYERGEWYQRARESDYGLSISTLQLQLFEDIRMHLNATNTSINDLMQKCGREVRKADVITVRLHQPDKNSSQNIEISETSYTDETTICYRLPFKEFSSLSEYIEINLNLNRSGRGKNNSPDVAEQVNIDLLGRENFLGNGSVKFDSSLFVKFGENVSAALRIEAEYNLLHVFNGIQRCSNAVSQEDCQKNCRVEAIRQLCNCVPWSWSNNTGNMIRHCSLNEHQTCLPLTSNLTLECISKCFHPCKRVRLSEKKVFFNAIEPHRANLIIRMKSFKFPVANERLKWTPSELQGSIGGALAFYIGLDALVLINAFSVAASFAVRIFTVFKGVRQQGVASTT